MHRLEGLDTTILANWVVGLLSRPSGLSGIHPRSSRRASISWSYAWLDRRSLPLYLHGWSSNFPIHCHQNLDDLGLRMAFSTPAWHGMVIYVRFHFLFSDAPSSLFGCHRWMMVGGLEIVILLDTTKHGARHLPKKNTCRLLGSLAYAAPVTRSCRGCLSCINYTDARTRFAQVLFSVAFWVIVVFLGECVILSVSTFVKPPHPSSPVSVPS